MRLCKLAVVFFLLAGCVACSRSNDYRVDGFKRQQDSTSASLGDKGEIVFDLRKGKQRIKATCNANVAGCSNFALKAGSLVDCYTHSSQQGRSVPYSYGVKMDAYSNDEASLVCHSGEGRGKLSVIHKQTCVEMKKVVITSDGGKFVVLDVARSATTDSKLDAEFGPQLTWTTYVPAAFDEGQRRKYLQELNDTYGKTGQLPIPPDGITLDQPQGSADRNTPPSFIPDVPEQAPSQRPLLPSGYEGYTVSEDKPLRFCKLEQDHYFNERGKEVQDDTVLLTIVESSLEKQ
jgi:hypothetical protein